MSGIMTMVAIGFAQRYLEWGDWVWFLFGIVLVVKLLAWVVEATN